MKNNNYLVIFVTPKRKDVFKYKIDDGEFHIKKTEQLKLFLKDFVEFHQVGCLDDLFQRYRTFAILNEEGEALIREFSFHSDGKIEDIEKELSERLKKGKEESLPKQEDVLIRQETKIDSILKKFII